MRYLTAREAADELDISLATLYSYVSRGLIRSEQADTSKRTRRYSAEDVARLKQRQQARANPDRRAEGALHWGVPVMESALTLIDDGQLFYHGHAAADLAQTTTLEQVAGLLWLDDPAQGDELFAAAAVPRVAVTLPTLLPVVNRLQVVLAHGAALDFAAHDLRPEAVTACGARILKLMLHTVVGETDQAAAAALAESWAVDDPYTEAVIQAALILCADHELNLSSFTARCVASAAATPYAVVIAGLSALSGHKHGGFSERVAALFREVQTPDQALNVLAARLRRGEGIPGFGHPLYPGGDPRAALLLDLIADAYSDAPALALTQAIADAADHLTGDQPNVDLALFTLAAVFGHGAEGAMTVFALGRTVGWIGHALEGYAGQLIRPRAHYVGRLPESGR